MVGFYKIYLSYTRSELGIELFVFNEIPVSHCEIAENYDPYLKISFNKEMNF